MFCTSLDRHRDLGLLLLRFGIGIMFMYHGWPKIMGGTATWAKLGGAISNFGITFFPVFWGFMAAFAEFGGGLLLVLGLFFRIANLLLTITMIVAISTKFASGVGFAGAAQPIELGILFLSLILIGPGKYSFDENFRRR
ncbi:DoxX family protein [Dendrosporobacter sp. 1207_IL3150]|uniref:DoxX family protein n=1 Tax=Dendrosporobacter sp. 1207_IL3150 TaxID=3084054 RepID=UPI002FDA70AA